MQELRPIFQLTGGMRKAQRQLDERGGFTVTRVENSEIPANTGINGQFDLDFTWHTNLDSLLRWAAESLQVPEGLDENTVSDGYAIHPTYKVPYRILGPKDED